MSRLPQQIHVYLYRKNSKGVYEYAIFQRSDNDLWWQGISGGVEEGETIEAGARREVFEEAGISDNLSMHKLETQSYLPAYIFSSRTQKIWGKDVLVIPMHFFAIPYKGKIKLSEEHKQFRWLPYEEAERLVYFHDQKTALWELNERLLRGNLVV